MTKALLSSLLLSAALAVPAGAQVASGAPDTGPYVNAGVDTFSFDTFGMSGKVGYNFSRFFGVEGQIGTGVIDDTVRDSAFAGGEILDLEADTGYDLFAGAFAVGRVPVTREIDVFGRVGYNFTQYDSEAEARGRPGGQFEGEVVEADVGVDTDGFAFGAGAQFNFGAELMSGIRVEYTRVDIDNISDVSVDNTDVEVEEVEAGDLASGDLWSLSYVRRF